MKILKDTHTQVGYDTGGERMAITVPAKTRMTVEEFWRLCADGKPRELVHGQVVETMPAGFEHGRIAQWVAAQLTLCQQQMRQYLGEVVIETGFVIRHPDGDSVRAPDVAFIRKERIPEPRPCTFAEFAPDLAVEVVSPNDSYTTVREKVEAWLQAGTEVVWVVDPRRRTVEVFQADAPAQTLREGDVLTCETILPGFALPLTTLFGGLQAQLEPPAQG
ncbi:MAG: Uma2 family endonuclease [Fimbriimonadales bacterium]